jgi:hypothetical protein
VGYHNCLEPLGRTGQGLEQLPGGDRVEEDADVEEQEGRAFHAVHLRHRDRRFQECYIGAPAGLVQSHRVWCGPEPDLGYPVADIDTSDLAVDAPGHVPQDRERSTRAQAFPGVARGGFVTQRAVSLKNTKTLIPDPGALRPDDLGW